MKHTVDTTEVESGWMVLKGHDPNRLMAKGTLVIGDERVFTESEVRALLKEITRDWRVTVRSIPAIKEIASRHGIVLDPA